MDYDDDADDYDDDDVIDDTDPRVSYAINMRDMTATRFEWFTSRSGHVETLEHFVQYFGKRI